MPSAADAPAYLELRFRPNLALITVVRRFVKDFYNELLADADATSRLVVATHELLENAVTYATDGESRISIMVETGADARNVEIITHNRTDPAHREHLAKAFRDMAATADSSQYYQAAMRHTAKRGTGSGLGLARIWAESEMEVSCDLEGDEVRIIARTRIPRPT
jgi:anti-sigma regulatory factor (Ser/Thr protein kinase)